MSHRRRRNNHDDIVTRDPFKDEEPGTDATEYRLAEIERRLGVVWGSSLGRELRRLEVRDMQDEVERRREAEAVARRVEAEPRRLGWFDRFVGERLTVVEDGQTVDFALAKAFGKFCADYKVKGDERMGTEDVFAAVAGLGGVEKIIVRAGPQLGKMPGLGGVEVQEKYRDPNDCKSRAARGIDLEREAGRADRVEARRLEDELQYPTPKRPHPKFRVDAEPEAAKPQSAVAEPK